ncbi:molybdopterin converting factor subunit 1 [Nordella sp. HKS 07]|uniref:molybdopterin converting factor subunit 1 n=1 Tax=Nordella sp. HKS 07 TaxID=2712222 RepID=UPI0013E1DED3|nr:molybdopterin converting factor subunit 1 [Nordella sp. HKS 07]QIG46490.1 molybdopterin converting factor subunit 1 [Nordella sp. HKS 07]
MTKLLYFARMRQIIGKGEEEITLPAEVTTVNLLIDFLKKRDEAYAAAFADPRIIRAAINQAHAPLDASIAGAREIAFFPPVTGG